MTTLQAVSGAGKIFALKNNVIPHILGEEEKSEKEPFKIPLNFKQSIKYSEQVGRYLQFDGK